jgi:hypothetical protein
VKEGVELACARKLINGVKNCPCDWQKGRESINMARAARLTKFRVFENEERGKTMITKISDSLICSEAEIGPSHKYLITCPV